MFDVEDVLASKKLHEMNIEAYEADLVLLNDEKARYKKDADDLQARFDECCNQEREIRLKICDEKTAIEIDKEILRVLDAEDLDDED